MRAKPTGWPDVRAKLEAKRDYAQRRADHFEGAVTATTDASEKSHLEFLAEHWTGRLQGFTEALEIASELEMAP